MSGDRQLPRAKRHGFLELTDSERPTISEDDKKSSEVAFFLGAGASVEAHVPHTVGLKSEFVKSLGAPEATAVQKFLDRLEQWANTQTPRRTVDIELVLEALHRIVEWKDAPLSAFLTEKPKTEGFDPAFLLKTLRDFIKTRVMVEAINIAYLAPLRGFIDQFRPLNIFSANYDTAIEVFCAEHKLKYRDGFDETWNPRVFYDSDTDIKLFKIHGSVTWYRTDRGRFVKIPIVIEGSSVELITKERAELLMLYPAQKFEYVEPLFELALQMKRELAQCETLLVVGYSFRDEHIRRLFWDIARENVNFHVVLIDPQARGIYRDRLAQYDDGKTTSSLAGRVVCLPYFFGRVLPALQSVIYLAFQQTQAVMNEQLAMERRGGVTHWKMCIEPAATCGDYEALKIALEKSADESWPGYRSLMVGVTLGLFHAAANGDHERAAFFWEKFRSLVLDVPTLMIVYVDITKPSNYIRPQMFGGTESPNSVRDAWIAAREAVIPRLQWLGSGISISWLSALFEELSKATDVWKMGSVSMEEYSNQRNKSCPPDLKELLTHLRGHSSTVWDGKDRKEELQAHIRAVERKVLTDVLVLYNSKVVAP